MLGSIHLSRMIVTNHLKRHLHLTMDTALHTGKDLAVSLLPFDRLVPEGTLAFRHRRHCSHLYSHLRRALPATLLMYAHMRVYTSMCSDFPLYTKAYSEYPKENMYIIQQKSYSGNVTVLETQLYSLDIVRTFVPCQH